LAQIFARIPQDIFVNATRALPALVAGHGRITGLLLTSLLGEASGLKGEMRFGPNSPEEMIQIVNSPAKRSWQNFISFLAMSSDSRPKMNMSSQFKMLLAGREGSGAVYIEKQVTKRKEDAAIKKEFVFNELNHEDVQEFIKALNEETIPLVQNNAHLRAFLTEKMRRSEIVSPLIRRIINDANNNAAAGRPHANPADYTADLSNAYPKDKDVAFRLYDWQHEDKHQNLAQIFTDVLTVSSRMNISRGAADYKDLEVKYFNPLEAAHNQKIPFSDKVDYAKTIRVFRTDASKIESVAPAVATEITDSMESLKVYSQAMIDDLKEAHRRGEISDLVFHNLVGVFEGTIEAFAKFSLAIPRQINAGWTEFLPTAWNATEGAAHGVVSSDWASYHAAVDELNNKLSHLIGSFYGFETLVFPMFSEGIASLKKGPQHLGVGLGQLVYVMGMTLASARAAFAIHAYAAKAGAVVINNGAVWIDRKIIREYIRKGAPQPEWLSKRAMPQLHMPAGTGAKMMYYATPVGNIHLAVKLIGGAAETIRYNTGNASFTIRPDFEIVSGDSVAADVSGVKNGWHKLWDFGSRTRVLHPLRELGRVRDSAVDKTENYARRAAERLGSRPSKTNGTINKTAKRIVKGLENKGLTRAAGWTASNFLGSTNPNGTVPVEEAQGLLELAKTDPGRRFVVEIKGRAAKANNAPVRLRVTGADLLELAKAGSIQKTTAIIERIQKRGKVYTVSQGSMAEIHAFFEPFRQGMADSGFQPRLAAVAETRTNRGTVELINEWAQGKGLLDRQIIRFNDEANTGRSVEMNGSQIARLLSGQTGGKEPQIDVDFTVKLNIEGGSVTVPGRLALQLFSQKPFAVLDQLVAERAKAVSENRTKDIKQIDQRITKVAESIEGLRTSYPDLPLEELRTLESVPELLQERVVSEYGTSMHNQQMFQQKLARAAAYRPKEVAAPTPPTKAEIANEVKAARRDLELARDKALARIESQNIPAERKAQMRTEALHTWEREMFGLEKAIVEKRALEAEIKTQQTAARQLYGEIKTLREQLKAAANNPAETARLKSVIGAKTAQLEGIRKPLDIKVRTFARAHGPMIALILGLDIVMNWQEIKTGGVGQAAATGAAALGSYLAFAAGEEAFVNLFKVGKGAAGPLTGAALGVTVAALRHKETLMGGDRSAKAAALADIVKEGVAGYLAVKAGALAAAPLAENPVLAGAVGLGVGALVYGGIEWGGNALGYKQWIDKTVTKGHLVDSFKEKDKFGIYLKVNNGSADLPYFNEQSETVTVDGQTVKISKAQQFLGVMQAAVNYNKMRPAEREEFIKQNGEFGRVLGRYMRTINQINQLEVNGYTDLNTETLDRVNSAIEQYREENGLRDSGDGNIIHRFDIKVNRRFAPVNDPITGQTVGQQVLYDIEVTGARVSLGFGQAGIDQLYETKTYSGNGVEGNLDRLLQASIILQTADPEA
ncbi:MAG: hypothetical protein PHG97_05915, partial [Candidatus Margulisbacteria bacterium]|nr:hypothetical protein [Candidatus Margulisiibacteriota bacterium]